MTAKKFTRLEMRVVATKATKDKEDLDAFKTEAAKHVERLLEVAENVVYECMRQGDEKIELIAELKSVRKELGL